MRKYGFFKHENHCYIFILAMLALYIYIHIYIYILQQKELHIFVGHVNQFNRYVRHIFSPNEDDLSYSARTIFPWQHKNGESPSNSLFLRIFRARWTYFLSSLFIAAESQHHEESHLIYGPLSLSS